MAHYQTEATTRSANGGHVSNRSEGLIVVMTMLLLKTTRYKTSLVALKGTIQMGLDLVHPLARDGSDTQVRGTRSKVPVRSKVAISSDIASCHSG